MKERQAQFRALMGRHVSGVSVLACVQNDEIVAMTVGSVTSVSLQPLLILACIRHESRLLPALLRARTFSVNLLSGEQTDISRFYGGQTAPSSTANWATHASSVPVLAGANASMICHVHSVHDAGDHAIVVGAVDDMLERSDGYSSLAYVNGRYLEVPLRA